MENKIDLKNYKFPKESYKFPQVTGISMKDTQKLDPEFKARWIAALRSGDYLQTKEVMHDGTGYCCLGVACVVAGIKPKGLVVDKREGYTDEDISKYPKLLYGSAQENQIVKILTAMNDGNSMSRRSFSEIADYIEQNL